MKTALKKTKLFRAFRRTKLYEDVVHFRRLLGDREYADRDRAARADFMRFCRERGGFGLSRDLRPRTKSLKTALILSQAYLPFAKLEALVMKAMHMAGYDTVVCGNRRYDFMRYGWLAGNKRVIEFADFPIIDPQPWVDEQMVRLSTLDDWLQLTFNGMHVGRFVIATVLRSRKVGQLDLTDPAIREILRGALWISVRHALAAVEVLDAVKPDLVLVMDRGYSGFGEMFDAAIDRGIDTLTWNLGYKSNRLVFKRYHTGNEREHPLSPSEESWRCLRELPWKDEYTRQLRGELFDCYEKRDWFSVVGSQFDKKILAKEATRSKLGLSGDRKVAVIFAHILWDGSFFYGKDLFEDYTQWFVGTVRAAIANPRVQWLVKLHPAHIVKRNQQNETARPAELDVLEKEFAELPEHVTLVHPDTDVSTYSLFEIADYTVTVRGTVGIESALFGIPVITAGTGRFDRRGFTVDSSTREEYLQKLATLETIPRLSTEQVQLAERYAYGVFFCRPLTMSCASLEYERDKNATPKVTVRCRSREEWLASPDMQRLARWLGDRGAEDLPGLPC
jgi:hypothetical protein